MEQRLNTRKGIWEITEKASRPVVLSCTIPTCENSRMTPPTQGPVPRVSRSQSEGEYAHIKGTGMPFCLCVLVYPVVQQWVSTSCTKERRETNTACTALNGVVYRSFDVAPSFERRGFPRHTSSSASSPSTLHYSQPSSYSAPARRPYIYARLLDSGVIAVLYQASGGGHVNTRPPARRPYIYARLLDSGVIAVLYQASGGGHVNTRPPARRPYIYARLLDSGVIAVLYQASGGGHVNTRPPARRPYIYARLLDSGVIAVLYQASGGGHVNTRPPARRPYIYARLLDSGVIAVLYQASGGGHVNTRPPARRPYIYARLLDSGVIAVLYQASGGGHVNTRPPARRPYIYARLLDSGVIAVLYQASGGGHVNTRPPARRPYIYARLLDSGVIAVLYQASGGGHVNTRPPARRPYIYARLLDSGVIAVLYQASGGGHVNTRPPARRPYIYARLLDSGVIAVLYQASGGGHVNTRPPARRPYIYARLLDSGVIAVLYQASGGGHVNTRPPARRPYIYARLLDSGVIAVLYQASGGGHMWMYQFHDWLGEALETSLMSDWLLRAANCFLLAGLPDGELHSLVNIRASAVCSLAAATVLPHTWQYGIRYLFLCKFPIGSESSRAYLINCDPIAKEGAVVTQRLENSLPTKANRARLPAHEGILPDDAAGQRVFSGISRSSRPCITALLHRSTQTSLLHFRRSNPRDKIGCSQSQLVALASVQTCSPRKPISQEGWNRRILGWEGPILSSDEQLKTVNGEAGLFLLHTCCPISEERLSPLQLSFAPGHPPWRENFSLQVISNERHGTRTQTSSSRTEGGTAILAGVEANTRCGDMVYGGAVHHRRACIYRGPRTEYFLNFNNKSRQASIPGQVEGCCRYNPTERWRGQQEVFNQDLGLGERCQSAMVQDVRRCLSIRLGMRASPTTRLQPRRAGFEYRRGYPVFYMWETCARQWVLSGISCFPRPCIPAPVHTHLISPSSALKTSMSQHPRHPGGICLSRGSVIASSWRVAVAVEACARVLYHAHSRLESVSEHSTEHEGLLRGKTTSGFQLQAKDEVDQTSSSAHSPNIHSPMANTPVKVHMDNSDERSGFCANGMATLPHVPFPVPTLECNFANSVIKGTSLVEQACHPWSNPDLGPRERNGEPIKQSLGEEDGIAYSGRCRRAEGVSGRGRGKENARKEWLGGGGESWAGKAISLQPERREADTSGWEGRPGDIHFQFSQFMSAPCPNMMKAVEWRDRGERSGAPEPPDSLYLPLRRRHGGSSLRFWVVDYSIAALRVRRPKPILNDTCCRTWFSYKLPQGLVHETNIFALHLVHVVYLRRMFSTYVSLQSPHECCIAAVRLGDMSAVLQRCVWVT
ncbi:hypothetical protein PR048_014112 [Dryococelus australis]|uniref:Uncharacterized protein n=1 Tax=Dryococelus australis TaxID=614101 RepID=A0ABQ9HDK7_9NEOP|nr:hypothetical protein PR048_014112 [Dryococelus australis]